METEKSVENESFEIENLEYDVGGAGAVEASDTMVNHGANFAFSPVRGQV